MYVNAYYIRATLLFSGDSCYVFAKNFCCCDSHKLHRQFQYYFQPRLFFNILCVIRGPKYGGDNDYLVNIQAVGQHFG